MEQATLDRIAHLIEQRRAIDGELSALIGGDKPKRKWTRRAESEEAPQQSAE